MKRLSIVILVSIMFFSLLGCTAGSEGDILSSVKSFIKGDVTGELNKSYSTQWFDFTVKTIKTAYQYGDYVVNDGKKFVIVRVSETGTFNEPTPMSVYDFSIEADGLSEEVTRPSAPLGDNAEMMPVEFMLAKDQTVEYDVIFAIPDEIMEIGFVYIEFDERNQVGATFTIKHAL